MEQVKDVGGELDVGGEGEAATAKRRSAGTDSEPGLIRLRLSAQLSLQVRNTITDLKNRGVAVSAEELLERYLDAVPDQYFARQILLRTPEEFYIREAIQVPELREKLAKQAMKALLHKRGGAKTTGLPKKSRTKGSAREEAVGAAPSQSQGVTTDGAY